MPCKNCSVTWSFNGAWSRPAVWLHSPCNKEHALFVVKCVYLFQVSAVRTEDLKVCTEDLHKVLSEVQEMREQQNNMDVRLANMKR